LGCSLAVSPILIGISVWKWRLLLQARGVVAGFGELYGLYLVGCFFNHFLPTSVGGDVSRGYLLGRARSALAATMASTFMERLTGLTALIALVTVGVVLNLRRLATPTLLAASGIAVAGYLLVLWLCFDRRLWALAVSLPLPSKLGLVREKLGRLLEEIRAFGDEPSVLWRTLALSIAFHLGAVLNVWVTGRAFGIHASMLDLLALVPVILLVALVPISVGGIGVMEWAYVYCLGLAGVSPAGALAIALLLRVKRLLNGVAGGGIYLVWRVRPVSAEHRAVQ
jgi:uncharacterized protein (TIRG00374 family)